MSNENTNIPISPLPVAETIDIVGVRFRAGGKAYYFDPCGVQYFDGDNAIVETSRGLEYGEVVIVNKQVKNTDVVQPLRRALRRATPADDRHFAQNQQKRVEAMEVCAKKIEAHGLDMKLIDVEYTFDNSKLLFYFTSDGRVDFRELVKELASHFRCRIELRQMGIRDEAKMLGGLGICGRAYCCSTFLSDFTQVSIRMAKDQSISLNSAKISGACGKLMCCLKFEHDTYAEALRNMPKMESVVQTPDGEGTVVEVRPLVGMVKVKLHKEDGPPQLYDTNAVKSKKGKDV
jgi:cell fate regulator YaaT (PSP1 superfamily)